MDQILKETSLEALLFHPEEKGNDNSALCVPDTSTESEDVLEFYSDEEGTKNIPLPVEGVWKDSADKKLIDAKSQESLYTRNLLSKANESFKISEYEETLRKRHRSLHGNTSWARIRTEEEKQTDAARLDHELSSEDLLSTTHRLPKGRIEIRSELDPNGSDKHRSKLSSMEYNSSGELFMSAMRNGRICFFHIDGIKNPLLDSISIHKFKLIKAGFIPNKQQVIAVGSPHFQSIHVLDLETKTTERIHSQNPKELYVNFESGKGNSTDLIGFINQEGTVPLYSVKSQQWLTRIQSGRKIEAFEFSPNGVELITCATGEFIDQGTLHCTALKICPQNQYLASGSDAGVANIYKTKDCVRDNTQEQNPAPLKTLFNLKTEINCLEFHPDSQILAMASVHAPSALKLVHLPSCTVFSNCPNQRLSNAYIKCVSFSPNQDLLHIGSVSGRISTFKLLHYSKV